MSEQVRQLAFTIMGRRIVQHRHVPHVIDAGTHPLGDFQQVAPVLAITVGPTSGAGDPVVGGAASARGR